MSVYLEFILVFAIFSAVVQAAVLPHIRERYRQYHRTQTTEEKHAPDLTKDTTNNYREKFEAKNKDRLGNDGTPITHRDSDIIGFERRLNLSDTYVYRITKRKGEESREAVEYLWRYGYLMDDMTLITRHTVVRALRNFQRRSNIKQTGTITNETINRMRQPRCGNKDGDGTDSLSRRHKRYKLKYDPRTGNTMQWQKRYITYKVFNYSLDLSPDFIDEQIRIAFQYWSNVTSLVFEHTTCNEVDIKISFERGDHNCGYAFKPKAIAHAFPPVLNCDGCGDVHFDDDDTFTEGRTRTLTKVFNFLYVATHELGHSLGLSHSSPRKAVMYFDTPDRIRQFDLHKDDIAGIQNLYGDNTTIYTGGNGRDGPLDVRCIKPRPGYAPPIAPDPIVNWDTPEHKPPPARQIEQSRHTNSGPTGCMAGYLTRTMMCIAILIGRV